MMKDLKENLRVTLAETVVLIDAAYLNFVSADARKYFEHRLRRPLQEIDLAELATYLLLDAGLKEGENEIQFLFVYDKDSESLARCSPSSLEQELDGVAFRGELGECVIASVPSEGMVSREEIFLDLLAIVADATEVKRIVVVPFDEEYGGRVMEVLNAVEGKELFCFRMSQPEHAPRYTWGMLALPLMQAMGIRGDEL